MNRRSISVLCGLGLAVACTGGGAPNDFGLGPSDNAPTDPGAPPDPNAPPGNPNDPPFADGRATGDVPDCRSLCAEVVGNCGGDFDDYDECVDDCLDITPACRSRAGTYARCVARNGCNFDQEGGQDEVVVCEAELVALITCVGPDPDPPGGEGGAGGM